jgi:hypothetical protein
MRLPLPFAPEVMPGKGPHQILPGHEAIYVAVSAIMFKPTRLVAGRIIRYPWHWRWFFRILAMLHIAIAEQEPWGVILTSIFHSKEGEIIERANDPESVPVWPDTPYGIVMTLFSPTSEIHELAYPAMKPGDRVLIKVKNHEKYPISCFLTFLGEVG